MLFGGASNVLFMFAVVYVFHGALGRSSLYLTRSLARSPGSPNNIVRPRPNVRWYFDHAPVLYRRTLCGILSPSFVRRRRPASFSYFDPDEDVNSANERTWTRANAL